MRRANILRHLAGTTLLLLQLALALPQAGITAAPSPIQWVTVDATGSAETITPGVITTKGHLATVSQAPAEVTTTITTVLSVSGNESHYTGLPPVVSATGRDGSLAGVFPACDSNANVGPVEPFCLPKAGSHLLPGKIYYVTWSPTYFSPPDIPLTLQVRYTLQLPNSSSSSSSTEGFTTPPIPASKGFHPFSLPADFFESRGTFSPFNLTFLLAYADDSSPENPDDLTLRVGPTVYVTPDLNPDDDLKTNTPNLVNIAVPVVVVGTFLLITLLCFLSWRRTGVLPLLGIRVGKRAGGGTSGGRGSGYGVRQSRAERVGHQQGAAATAGMGAGVWGADNKSETDVGIQLTDRESWSPTGRGPGRNVFREEVERQARLG